MTLPPVADRPFHLRLVVLDGLFARETEGSLAFHRTRGAQRREDEGS